MPSNKAITKAWFETGDYPTQEQFAQWMDWIRWKEEEITLTDIDSAFTALLNGFVSATQVKGLYSVTLTNNANFSWALPVGTVLEKVFFENTSNLSITMGTTNGGIDILELEVPAADKVLPVILDLKYKTSKTIYFGGILANTKTTLLIRTT